MSELRLEQLRATLQEEAAMVVLGAKSRRYLSGFSGSAGWLVITPQRQFILTDGRYWDQASRQCPDFELFKFESSTHKSLQGALGCLLKDTLKLESGAPVGVEVDEISLLLFRKLREELAESGYRIKEIEGAVRQLRSRKDEAEVELLRQAAHIADRALDVALGRFEPGRTERDLKAELEFQILRQGGEGPSFSTIVASGVNGSYPHAGASEKVVKEGELITIDFGAVYQGYCSDMTRTIWYGQLTQRDRRVLQAVREAQTLAVKAVKPGILTGELDAVARDHLRGAKLAEYFVHSLGHGVGLDVHEGPTLRSGHTDALEQGQVITIEPGVYLPGETGCRVEDTVVVGSTVADVLNLYPKQALDASTPPRLP